MTLYYYIIKDYFKFVFGIVVLCVFLFNMFDFIHKTTKYFAKYQPSAEHIFQFYFFQIPMQMVQAIPIASLLASVVSMVLMSRTNEITAMRAAGMGPVRIALPIVVGGLILSAAAMFTGELIAPASSKQMRYVEKVLIENKPDSQAKNATQWLRRGAMLYHFSDYDPLSKRMNRIRIIDTGLNFRPKQTLEARFATYVPEEKAWQLNDIKVSHFNPNGLLARIETRESQMANIPIAPKKLKKERRTPAELALSELFELVSRDRESGVNVTSYLVEFHIKLAFYFAAFVVSFIGLKFAYRSERTVETAKGILLAIAIGLSYWLIRSVGKGLSQSGTIAPVIGAWVPNIFVMLFGIIEIWRVTRRAT